jgi:TP901 family phage tail tape measure protein
VPDIANGILIQIAADTARLRSGLADAEGQIGQFAQRAERVGHTISSWGGSLTQAFQPLGGFAQDSIAQFAGLESVMTDIRLYGGVAVEEMAAVEAAAEQMARTTQFSATQSAGAILEFAKAGYDAAGAVEMANAAARLATVGDLEMASAAGLLTTSMAQFNLTAGDTDTIIEMLARAAGASRADVNTLAQGLANVGPLAARFGLTFEDTTAILAMFADAGIQGAEGGTQLRSMLMQLSQPTDAVRSAMRTLNLELYDAEGNLLPIAGIFEDLQDRMTSGEYSAETLNTAMQSLFGTYGIIGAQVLSGAGGWNEMTAAMDGATSAADIYAGKQETLQFALTQTQTAWEGVKTSLGAAMSDTLTPVIGDLTTHLNNLSTWIDENPGVAGTLGTVAVAGLAIGAALMILGPLVTAFAKGLGLLTALGALISGTGIFTALAAALPPLASALGLVAAPLVIILGVLRSDMDNEGMSQIGEGFGAIGDAVARFAEGNTQAGMNALGKGLRDVAEGALKVVAAPLDGVILMMNDLGLTDLTGLNDLLGMWSGILSMFPILLVRAAEDIDAGWQTFSNSIKLGIADLMTELQNNPLTREAMRLVAPEFVMTMEGLTTVTGKPLGELLRDQIEEDIAQADLVAAIENEINRQMSTGDITLGGGMVFTNSLGQTVSMTVVDAISTALTDPAYSDDIDSSLYTTLVNAMALAGEHDYEFLVNAADALVLYGEVHPVIQSFMQDAVAGGVNVTVPVWLNPVIAGSGVIPTEIAGQFNVNPATGVARPGSAGLNLGNGITPADTPGKGGGSGKLPTFATGGMMWNDGLAYLHGGERVLNKEETRAYQKASASVTIHAYGQSPHDLAVLIERALADRGR